MRRVWFYSANERSKGEGKGRKRKGKEKGKGKLEVKLWQKRKKLQTPQPGIEPGTPANVADPCICSTIGRASCHPSSTTYIGC